jgi:hypothetical protein
METKFTKFNQIQNWFELIQKKSKGNWESALCIWAQPTAEPRPAWLNTPVFLGVSAQPRKQGRGIGLGVTSVDGDPDLRRRAAGGSPWWACGGDVDRAAGCTDEVVDWLWLARLVRMEINPELGRCYWWGRWDWKSTRGGGRRWPGYDSDGGSSGSKG